VRVLNRSLFALPLTVFGLLPGDSLASKDGGASPLLFVAPSGARPYIFSEGGKTIGIVADIAHEISALIQRPIEIKMHDFRKARRMVRDGEADAVLPLSLTPERLNQFDISNPLFTIAFTVFARENESRPPEWPNLEGVRVGVFEKGMSKVLAEKWFPKATMVAVRGTGNATRSLQQSAIDAMITARRAGNQAIYQEKISNVAALPVTLLSTPVGIAVSKGNDALYTTLNGAIDTLQARGMITHILGKWERTRVLLFTKQDVWTVAGLTAFGVSASFLLLPAKACRSEKSG